MEAKLFTRVFVSIFLAELADKTQIATIAFAASEKEKLTVLAASILALAVAATHPQATESQVSG